MSTTALRPPSATVREFLEVSTKVMCGCGAIGNLADISRSHEAGGQAGVPKSERRYCGMNNGVASNFLRTTAELFRGLR